jgi:hypothetical protein
MHPPKIGGKRRMLFANMYDQREVDLVAKLCVLEGVSISNLMRRAIAGLCDEQGLERPDGVFDDIAAGNSGRAKKEIAGVMLPLRRGRKTDDQRMSKESFVSRASK